jgi:hypothetical protein
MERLLARVFEPFDDSVSNPGGCKGYFQYKKALNGEQEQCESPRASDETGRLKPAFRWAGCRLSAFDAVSELFDKP